jgi:1-acyl-sn-glycerol-3-phosphate acyltransferase
VQLVEADALRFRDPALIARVLPALRAYMRHYVRLHVEGLEHVTRSPGLFVGNHNGGIFGPDLPCTLGVLWEELGPDAPLYAMAHDFAMRQFTPFGRVLRRFGALRAHPDNARAVLAAGGQVLVYPGGDLDAYRGFRQRHQVVLGQRTGFLRVAAQAGVPIVPVVASGAHRSAIIVYDGAGIAELLHLKRWARLERFPIALALPWGVALGPWLPYLPLPWTVRLRFLPPFRVSASGLPEQREALRERMQSALVELGGGP